MQEYKIHTKNAQYKQKIQENAITNKIQTNILIITKSKTTFKIITNMKIQNTKTQKTKNTKMQKCKKYKNT